MVSELQRPLLWRVKTVQINQPIRLIRDLHVWQYTIWEGVTSILGRWRSRCQGILKPATRSATMNRWSGLIIGGRQRILLDIFSALSTLT